MQVDVIIMDDYYFLGYFLTKLLFCGKILEDQNSKILNKETIGLQQIF